MGPQQKFHHNSSAGPLCRNIAHILWCDRRTAAVFDHAAVCSLLPVLLTFAKDNWYFEVTKMIDQEIPNYVYDCSCLKNAKGSSSYLILSQLKI